jgi:SAM-dependent methyltransferase
MELAPGRTTEVVGDGIRSALPPDRRGAPYDRHAAIYDKVIGNATYNRIVWGSKVADYAAFTEEALASGSGAFLDAGCGTAVFTAGVYRRASRPLVLTDLSLGMLARARDRLTGTGATLVQADIHDLPFAPGSFETVGCFSMLHVLDDPWSALASLRPLVAPGGSLFASMIVRDGGAVARRYLPLLRRRGEFGPLRTTDEFATVALDLFGPAAAATRTGSMAYLRVRG